MIFNFVFLSWKLFIPLRRIDADVDVMDATLTLRCFAELFEFVLNFFVLNNAGLALSVCKISSLIGMKCSMTEVFCGRTQTPRSLA